MVISAVIVSLMLFIPTRADEATMDEVTVDETTQAERTMFDIPPTYCWVAGPTPVTMLLALESKGL